MLRTSGTNTQSGNGSTTIFQIPHGLPFIPISYTMTQASLDSLNDSGGGACVNFYVEANFTNLVITYLNAPVSGTNNLTWAWSAECN